MARLCPMARAGLCCPPSCSIIRAMRTAALAFLILGFGVGFFAMNRYIAPRATEISRPLEQFVPQSAASPAVPADPATVKRLEDMLKADPKNFDVLRELGNLRYDERNFAEAAALYARALEVRPDAVDVRSDRGGALLQARRVDEAIEELLKVTDKAPTHPQALFILGVALIEGKGDREGALAVWKKLVETNPNLPELEAVKRQIQQIEEMTRPK
jgi:cytochrome c-type biogenesis protein CcmH/NrfG